MLFAGNTKFFLRRLRNAFFGKFRRRITFRKTADARKAYTMKAAASLQAHDRLRRRRSRGIRAVRACGRRGGEHRHRKHFRHSADMLFRFRHSLQKADLKGQVLGYDLPVHQITSTAKN